jgi:hypothetical protein
MDKNNKAENKSVSQQLLESYRGVLYQIKDYFDTVDVNDPKLDIDTRIKLVGAILQNGEKLGKNIETLGILEAKVQKEEIEKSTRRGNVKTSMFETD